MKFLPLAVGLLFLQTSLISGLRAADAPTPAEAKLRESIRALTLQVRAADNEKATLQATQAEAEAKAADAAAAALIPVADNGAATTAPGTELVLKAKREEVDLFYNQKSTARRTWKGGYASRGASTSRAAGGAAASNARLSSQGTLGGSKRALN